MEPKQNSQNHGSLFDRLPPLSVKYLWFVAQNLEAKDDDNQIGDQIFYTIHNPLSQYRFRIPELHNRRIRAYFHGWLILSNHPHNVNWSLWNPITSKLICFPQLNKKIGDCHECCLSSPPDDPSSIILLTTVEKPTFIFCLLGPKRKKLRWTEMSYAKQLRSMSGVDGFLENPTCCNGKVYALTLGPYYSFVIQVDIVVKGKEVVINLLPFVEVPHTCFNKCPFYSYGTSNSYLKGTCTDLFYIDIGFEDETRKTVDDVYFFKFNMARMMWEEMKDLKNATIFVEFDCHEDFVFYRPEIASEFSGYIHIIDKMSKVIYSYNIKGRTISLSSMPCLVQDDQSQVTASAMLEFRLGDHVDDSKQEEDKDYEIVKGFIARDEVKLQSRMDESHMLNVPFDVLVLNVPFDVLETIMELCVGVHYLNFSAVCKRHMAAPPVQWSSGTSLWRLRTYLLILPWLMVFEYHQGIITFTDPLLGDKYYIKIGDIIRIAALRNLRYSWLMYMAACKRCHMAAPPVQCSSGTSLRRLRTYLLISPWLMVIENHQGIKYYIKIPQKLIGFQIYCSRYSWLMYIIDGPMVFSNPFTNVIRELPEISYLEMSKVIYLYNIKGRTISLSSMPCLVQDDQRLGNHIDDSKQQEDKDYEIVKGLVARDEVKLQSRMDESLLLNVPFDVLETIMELCVGVDYLNFRAVCKRCHMAAPPIQWSSRTSLWRLRTYSLISPWLMVFDNHQGIITFTDPLLGDKYYIKIPQKLIGFQIYCSRYGWLLMYKIDGPLVFFNPFTNDIRELPEVGYLESFCFSAPPTSLDCMVVGFKTRGEGRIYVHFVAKEPYWHELSGGDAYSFRFPTFYGQDLYALCNDRGIDVFRKMGHEDYSWVVVVAEAPRSSCTARAKRFLVKCDQHLIQVIVGEFGESIEVFNLNDSNEQWERVYSLGKHMICICRTTCLCIEAKSPEMENKIYFPRLHSGKIVFYSLESCRYHTFNGTNGEESLGDFFQTEYHTSPHTWIEPSWS